MPGRPSATSHAPGGASTVGRYLDQARIGRPHLRQLALLGGGGFFDAFAPVTAPPSVPFRDLFRKPLGRTTAVCVLIAFYTFGSWVPTYLLDRGLSVEKSLGLSVLMQLGAIPGCLTGDRLGRKWVNVALFILMGLVGIWYGYSASTTELRMQGSAPANACARGSVIISPFLVGFTYGHIGVQGVFLGVLGVCVIGAVSVVLLAPETRKRSLEEIAGRTTATEPALTLRS